LTCLIVNSGYLFCFLQSISNLTTARKNIYTLSLYLVRPDCWFQISDDLCKLSVKIVENTLKHMNNIYRLVIVLFVCTKRHGVCCVSVSVFHWLLKNVLPSTFKSWKHISDRKWSFLPYQCGNAAFVATKLRKGKARRKHIPAWENSSLGFIEAVIKTTLRYWFTVMCL